MSSNTRPRPKSVGSRVIGQARSTLRIRTRARSLVRNLIILVRPPGPGPEIVIKDDSGSTVVDQYWNKHTVHYGHGRFLTAKESEAHLRKRNSEYPMFPELMDLYGDHRGETILDYGCGPGDDTTGFLLRSNASKVIGMDVSQKALGYLKHRLALHQVDPQRVELIRITDSTGKIPLPDASVDWVHCCGVLHHTTHPSEILKEFHRVLKPGAEGRLMLYNRDSVMYHLWIAYAQLLVNDAFPGLTADQAFTKSTDGPECPVSDAWAPQRVLDTAAAAGLSGTFRGGYVSVMEIDWWRMYGEGAKTDPRLAEEHRAFARELEPGANGLPMWQGKYAGIGGVYSIKKADSGSS